jgi:hypothetical protein
MIRALKEEDLQAAPRAAVFEMASQVIAAEPFLQNLSDADRWQALKMIDRIRRMTPAVRGAISLYLSSDELWCHECGETSCVHGYPD